MSEIQADILDCVWIEHFMNCDIHKLFRLSQKYTYNVQVDEDKNRVTITRSENKNYIDGFFEKESKVEVNAVVGENGCGKTSLLRAVFDHSIHRNTEDKPSNRIFIFRNGTILYVDENSNAISERFSSNKAIIDLNKPKSISLSFWSQFGEKIYYHSLALDYSIFNDFFISNDKKNERRANVERSKYDISTSALIHPEYPYGMERYEKTTVQNYFFEEFKKQLQFIQFYKNNSKKFRDFTDFQLPQKIYITTKPLNTIAEQLLSNHSDCEESIQTLKKAFDNSFEKDDPLKKLKHSIAFGLTAAKIRICAYIFSGCEKPDWEKFNRLLSDYASIVTKNRPPKMDNWEMMKRIVNNDDKQCPDKLRDEVERNSSNALNSLNEFIELLDKAESIDNTINVFYSGETLPISAEKLISSYFDFGIYYNFINFSWGLSSGEQGRLALFARLYRTLISQGNPRKLENQGSVLWLLDEADMLLHPRWQQNYVRDIVRFAECFIKIKIANTIQIILATHSPIMLSDIPKQNVLFLKKEDDGIIEDYGCNTFASNIFQLFREGFFIGETGIGVYAEEKLKEIVDHIHENDIDDNELRKLIAAVGDTFLRNKLNEEYLMYRSKKNETEKIQAERIAKLESANTELLKQQRLDHEEKANHKKEAEKILKKLDDLNYNEDNTMEVTETKKKPMDDLADVIREFMQRFID